MNRSASYVNGIRTRSGGTHEAGFRSGVVKAVRGYMETHEISLKGVTITAEDIREGIVAILTVFVTRSAVPGPDQRETEQPRR